MLITKWATPVPPKQQPPDNDHSRPKNGSNSDITPLTTRPSRQYHCRLIRATPEHGKRALYHSIGLPVVPCSTVGGSRCAVGAAADSLHGTVNLVRLSGRYADWTRLVRLCIQRLCIQRLCIQLQFLCGYRRRDPARRHPALARQQCAWRVLYGPIDHI
jgi:hypothetical protein